MAEQGLDAHVDDQRRGHHHGGRLAIEAGRVDEELLEIGGVGVEGEAAACGDHRHDHELAGMGPPQGRQARFRAVLGQCFERGGFGEAATQHIDAQRKRRADREGDAPAPCLQRGFRQQCLEQQGDGKRRELAADQRDILETRPETAVLARRHLRKIGRARAIFAADRQPLEHPGDDEDGGRRDADRGMVGHDRDHQRSHAHQPHRQSEAGLAPVRIGVATHHPGADGPHQEADREHRGGAQQLGGLIALRKEGRREIDGQRGIGVPVIPFDQIARRSADDRSQPSGTDRHFRLSPQRRVAAPPARNKVEMWRMRKTGG